MRRLIVCCFALPLAVALLALPTLAAQKSRAADKSAAQSSPGYITREVRHELIMLPDYGVFDNLAFRVDGTNVTLIGQVTKPILKSDAGNVVKKIEGVTGVDNQIQVLPPSSMDDGIRMAEYRAIYSESGLMRYAMQAVPPIHIIVDTGKVTLEGVVATQSDKDLANIRAGTVSGVFSVTNNLRVEGK